MKMERYDRGKAKLALVTAICGVTLLVGSGASLAAASDADKIPVFVELVDEPVTSVFLHANATAVAGGRDAVAREALLVSRAQLARIEQAQVELLPRLTSAPTNAQLLYRVQRVANGIAVLVARSEAAAIRALPGVRAVRPIIPKRLDLTRTVPFIGAPSAWATAGQITGQGVKVGIIDTGIDYYHRDFGGPGKYPSGSAFTSASWPRTPKVVGGYDFAGEDGTGSKPDPDPMDAHGHGTHVAGIIAGYGVTSDGSTFAGPWGAATSFAAFRVGPGVAPGAQLYALKVFGASGDSPTNVLLAAIEWSVDPNQDGDFSDRMDVINLSLGRGGGDVADPDVEALERAAALGVVVVAAAGNDGDRYMITSSPALATSAISVAASLDDGLSTVGLHIAAPAGIARDYVVGDANFGPRLAVSGVSGSLVYASPADGCKSLLNGPAIRGNIAFIDRNPDPNNACTFVTKVKNAQKVGASAVVVGNTRADYGPDEVLTMGGDDSSVEIPSVLVSRSTRAAILQALPSPGVSAAIRWMTVGDNLASFSSRGPRRGDAQLKPDISAPGAVVLSAALGTGNSGAELSGTSMAAPHISGVMALLKQLHPAWSVEELKALLLNTAAKDLYAVPNRGTPLVGASRAGAGRVDVAAALGAAAVAFDANTPRLVSLSFGLVEALDDVRKVKQLTVANKADRDETFTLGYRPVADLPGVTVRFPAGGTLTVPARASVTVPVELAVSASVLRNVHDASVAEYFAGDTRHWLSEATGFVTVTPSEGTALRVPLHAVVRAVAAMTSDEPGVGVAPGTGQALLHLEGKGIATGTAMPTDVVSLVSALELKDTLAPSDGSSGPAALRFIGVASDYQAQAAAGRGLADTTIYFGLASASDWSRPGYESVLEGDSERFLEGDVKFIVQLDPDNNGKYEFLVANEDEVGDIDHFVAATCEVATGKCDAVPLNGAAASELDTRLYFNNVMVLPVKASWLGLKGGSSRFSFRVAAAPSGALTGAYTFDPVKPGVSFAGTAPSGKAAVQPLFADLPGGRIQMSYDQAAFNTDHSKGVLLLHHHNNAGARVQALPVEFGDCRVSITGVDVGASDAGGSPLTMKLSAHVTATGCGGSPAYDWDFGDTSVRGTGAEVVHTYASPGRYAWRVVVSYGAFSAQARGTLTVTDPNARPPRRHLGWGQ